MIYVQLWGVTLDLPVQTMRVSAIALYIFFEKKCKICDSIWIDIRFSGRESKSRTPLTPFTEGYLSQNAVAARKILSRTWRMLGVDSHETPSTHTNHTKNPKTQEGPLYDPRLHFKCRSSLFTHARKRTRSTTLLILVFLLITLLRIFLLCALAPYQYSLIVVPDMYSQS